jgi:hypothetical protein
LFDGDFEDDRFEQESELRTFGKGKKPKTGKPVLKKGAATTNLAGPSKETVEFQPLF